MTTRDELKKKYSKMTDKELLDTINGIFGADNIYVPIIKSVCREIIKERAKGKNQ